MRENYSKSSFLIHNPQLNKVCLILGEIEQSSNLPPESFIILTSLPLNILKKFFHLFICLKSSEDLLPKKYLKYH